MVFVVAFLAVSFCFVVFRLFVVFVVVVLRGWGLFQLKAFKSTYLCVLVFILNTGSHLLLLLFSNFSLFLNKGMHVHYRVGWCLEFYVPSTAEGYLRMNHTVIIHLHCSKQVTKPQLCQIHC